MLLRFNYLYCFFLLICVSIRYVYATTNMNSIGQHGRDLAPHLMFGKLDDTQLRMIAHPDVFLDWNRVRLHHYHSKPDEYVRAKMKFRKFVKERIFCSKVGSMTSIVRSLYFSFLFYFWSIYILVFIFTFVSILVMYLLFFIIIFCHFILNIGKILFFLNDVYFIDGLCFVRHLNSIYLCIYLNLSISIA